MTAPLPAPTWLRADGDRVLVEVLATPRASRSRIAGLHDGRLKLSVAAPPVDGAANLELVRFLAAELRVARGDVEVRRGASGRRKTVAVRGLGFDAVRERLEP